MAQIFPKWTNDTPRLAAVGTAVLGTFVVFAFYWWASPKNTDVGYKPKQPVEYSHALHAGKADGQLGMDCRYCHSSVEKAGHAAVPPTATCMNCHAMIHTESPNLQVVRDAVATGDAIPWVRVHDLPDHAHFNHAAHLAAGVGCSSCHGRVDRMEVVHQVNTLSMGWCLDCHRNPDKHIRPQSEITNMSWDLDNDGSLGAELRAAHGIAPKQNCSTCHR
jgi:hypothetical protein